MLSERGLRRKMMAQEHIAPSKPSKKAAKRKATTSASSINSKVSRIEPNNNVKLQRLDNNNKDDMLTSYQPWVIQTYGDLAKTKTITLKKYARILRTLRGEEVVSADNSKFRFWVKAKGFHVGQPTRYEAKPADAIVGRYSVCDIDEGIPPINNNGKVFGSAKDPPLYVPNTPFKNSSGDPVYRKVAVVENFFDIIYNVHVELEGRSGKHAGQKRTYRTITETYAFLPREAVTRFLLGCTECQKHPRSPSPVSIMPTPSPSPTLQLCAKPQIIKKSRKTPSPIIETNNVNNNNCENKKRSSHPLDVCNLTSKDSPKSCKNNGEIMNNSIVPKFWSPVENIEYDECKNNKRLIMSGNVDYSLPITTTYLKYMRSLGCTDEDALKFENKHENLSTPELSENNDEDMCTGTGAMKDSDKFKLMLLAWNYHNQTQGNRNGDITDLSSVPGGEDMAGLWAQYHSALGLAKGKATPPTARDQSSPINAETGSAHDETSSSGNKEDEDDDDEESDDKIDTQTHDPERLKAFNMFVRLFVDENLDRMIPISKQPKEKIQAIIDSCTRQFPEFAERARKRIRTYLKSCRRNKRARDPNLSSWDATRPTPAHLTSVQAEQILATACENESHNAKRMRLGLEPVSQAMPVLAGPQVFSHKDTCTPTDTTASMNHGIDFSNNCVKIEADSLAAVFSSSTTPNSVSKSLSSITPPASVINVTNPTNTLGSTSIINGIGIANTTASSAPTAMYRPNFTQAFQRTTGQYPLFPGANPFGNSLVTNGPTDLSMKQKPLLNHKLSTGEMSAVRQLITGYRESAAFLLRSADELEQLLIQQQQQQQ